LPHLAPQGLDVFYFRAVKDIVLLEIHVFFQCCAGVATVVRPAIARGLRLVTAVTNVVVQGPGMKGVRGLDLVIDPSIDPGHRATNAGHGPANDDDGRAVHQTMNAAKLKTYLLNQLLDR
jgi:hypothetical protein